MDGRQKVIDRIRSSLRRKQPLDAAMQSGLRRQLDAHQVHVQPQYPGELTARMVERHLALNGTLDRITDEAQCGNVIARYLEQHELPTRLVVGKSPLIDGLADTPDLAVESRPARDEDRVCVSAAYAAVAETGTLVMKSSAGSPLTHNYLPEHHIVVLESSRIVRWQEDAWRLLRLEPDFPPRGICFISGPSKTADVEQTLVYGAHGPRCLHLVLVEPETREQ